MKHPFITGAVAGLAGLFLWHRRAWLVGLVHKIPGLHGAEGFARAPINVAGAAGTAVRHIQRYTFAAMQDQSPIVGLTHASYALNGLDMLEEIGGQDAVRQAGFDPRDVRALISKLQDMHAKKLHMADPYITQVLGLQAGFALPGAAPNGA